MPFLCKNLDIRLTRYRSPLLPLNLLLRRCFVPVLPLNRFRCLNLAMLVLGTFGPKTYAPVLLLLIAFQAV